MLFAVSQLSTQVLGDDFLIPGNQSIFYRYEKSSLIDNFTRWDGGHYLSIALNGYTYQPGEKSNTAFFPLYPLTISLASFVTRLDAPVAAVLLSNAFLLAAAYVFFFFCKEKWDEHVARRGLLYILLFPTAFFYSAVYSESLFLLLSVSTFWLLERKNWLFAGVLGALAFATRVVGGLIFPIAVLYVLQPLLIKTAEHVPKSKVLTALLAVSLILVGGIAYCLYLQIQFGSPWIFLEAQAEWGSNGMNFIKTYISLLATLSLGIHYPFFLMAFSSLLAVFFFGATFLVQSIKLNKRYLLYSFCLFIVPFGIRFPSLLRYTGVIFPLFIALALLPHQPRIQAMYVLITVPLQIVFFITFIRFGLLF